MVTMTPLSWFWIREGRITKSDGIALPNSLLGLNPGLMRARATEHVPSLEFPESPVNTVVPERHSRKRWGTPEGEQEEGPPRGGQSGGGAGIPHLRTPGGSPREHGSKGTMVCTCQRQKSLQSQYVAEMPRRKLRKA